MDRSRKARCGQRPRQEIAVMTAEPDALAGVGVEIGMGNSEGLGFRGGRIAKAVDIVMAVAFGVRDSDEGTERKVLLHGKARLAGQILACHKEFFTARAPFRRARR